MATYLYRIGRFAYEKKFVVVSIWLAILVAFGVGAATLAGPTNDAFSIPGTQAQQAQDLLAERFPGAKDPNNEVSARVVFAAKDGQTLDSAANVEAMHAVIAKLDQIPALAAPAKGHLADPVAANQQIAAKVSGKDPTIVTNAMAMSPLSPDKTVGYLDVPIEGGHDAATKELRDQIGAALQVGRDAGLTVQASGTAVTDQAPPGGSTELVGIGVAAIVLMLTFGSLVAAGLPLITAIIGIVIGSLGITIATGFMTLSSMTPTLAIMIGLAVAIDYSLFIVSRFRHELNGIDAGNPRQRAEAAGRAVGTAGSAVVFAGLTVVIALLALRVVGIPFLTDMGSAAAFTVAIAVLIALTLLPAILGLFGRKAFAGRLPFVGRNTGEDAPWASRFVRTITRRPLLTLVAAVALLGAMALPVARLSMALPTDANADPATSARQAYDLIDKGFGPGKNGPLVIVADARDAHVPQNQAFEAVVNAAQASPDVANAQIVAVNHDGDTAQILVTPKSGPDSDATKNLVAQLRSDESALNHQTGVHFGVTGLTGMEIDISDTLGKALVPYLAVVVGLAFLLLMLVFRSILVPLTATLGFLLSVGATIGATVLIFQEGWAGIISNPGPIVSFMPIFLIGVVFGLAMDYQVFLVSRMREAYVHGESAKDAIISGFSHGARVVTAAAIIMISVFAAFIAEPGTFIKAMGFALAAAVFFDAFIVRMVIIPSVMAVLGDRAWWLPAWLDRILPNVDIEGTKLTEATVIDVDADESDAGTDGPSQKELVPVS